MMHLFSQIEKSLLRNLRPNSKPEVYPKGNQLRRIHQKKCSAPQVEEVPIPPKKKDYLQELRVKRAENGNSTANQAEEWQRYNQIIINRIMKNETLPQNARY